MSFEIHQQNELLWLSSPLLDGCSGIRHGFSTRKGGVSLPPWDSLNLRTGCGDAPDALQENYRRFCAAVGTDVERTVLSRQVHETTVRVCTAADAGKGLLRERDYTADALVTNEPDLPLLVFSADCGIILLYDPSSRSIGAVHAGWRGCAAGIVEKTVQTMVREYGARPETVLAAVGPCIGRCCFETDGDVPEAMRAALGADAEGCLERRGAKYHVDLAGLNRQWLLRAGVLPEHIDVSGLCTACRTDWFWSYRKMGDARGAQAAMIALSGRQ
ncbi:peptidoglycan editing factor PgeF [Dysosmobacter sp. HCP28S3_G4]|uniref:peptidoglycan editing factor PgeF n=1 Tax=Dysosmobacter sp. HCP28S3_G4 TaxID=3438938 RepID=UPI003F8B2009